MLSAIVVVLCSVIREGYAIAELPDDIPTVHRRDSTGAKSDGTLLDRDSRIVHGTDGRVEEAAVRLSVINLLPSS